jgi:hypothetical protein
MNLLKYSEQCRRLQWYRIKCKNLGPGTPEKVSEPIMRGLRTCIKAIDIMERTMILEFNLKGTK